MESLLLGDGAGRAAGFTEEETEAPTQEIQTAAPVIDDEKEGGCGSIISVTSALVAIIALGAVCIKKRD